MQPLFTEAAEKLFWHYKDNNLKQERNKYELLNGQIHLKTELT